MEFNDRLDGYKVVKKMYYFNFFNVKIMEFKLCYIVVKKGDINFIDVYFIDVELK